MKNALVVCVVVLAVLLSVTDYMCKLTVSQGGKRMPSKLIGVAIRGNKASEALAMIEQAEQLGIHAAWMGGSFELCGAEADGAISWICPGEYLRDVGLPAMHVGAERAGRPVPPLIAHAPVCVHDHAEEVRDAVREQIQNPRLPFYRQMLVAAGFPEAEHGTWSDAMIDAGVLWGDEARVAERLHTLLTYGATEILASPVLAGRDRTASLERTMRLLGRVAQSLV